MTNARWYYPSYAHSYSIPLFILNYSSLSAVTRLKSFDETFPWNNTEAKLLRRVNKNWPTTAQVIIVGNFGQFNFVC